VREKERPKKKRERVFKRERERVSELYWNAGGFPHAPERDSERNEEERGGREEGRVQRSIF